MTEPTMLADDADVTTDLPMFCANIDFTRCAAVDYPLACAIVARHLPSAKPLAFEAVQSLFVVSFVRLKVFRLGEIMTELDEAMPGARLFDPAELEDVDRLLPSLSMRWEELEAELLGRIAGQPDQPVSALK